MEWYTYILECSDSSFYVGHTFNLSTRLDVHNAGQGAIYTKVRRPVVLVYSEQHSGKADAIAREKQIKCWSKVKKQALIAGRPDMLHALARRRDT